LDLLKFFIIIVASIVPALNWANCWKLLFVTKSAGNYKILGSYRIFRDYTPTYICYKTLFNNSYKSFQNLHIKNNLSYKYYSQLSYINNNSINNDKFSYYLTGLIEGDGTIVVPKTKMTKGRLNYPSIQIIFNLK